MLTSYLICDQLGNFAGCTPGYWKQEQHFDSWVIGYSPTTTKLSEVIYDLQIPIWTKGDNKSLQVTDPTLLQALNAQGGGINALVRHTVAALLNAANSSVDFPLGEAQIITFFISAYNDGYYEKSVLNAQEKAFDNMNNEICPLS